MTITRQQSRPVGPIKFDLGRTLATPGALEALEAAGQQAAFFLDRHVSGDWGQCCEEDAEANDRALLDGSRIFSVYQTLRAEKVWIITEAIGDDGHRAATTILLPEEY